jgi:magnesium chelatase family protein
MTDKAKNVMNRAYKAYGLSVRSYHKLIRVARTIADLDDAYYIEEKHIAEALGYRTELF